MEFWYVRIIKGEHSLNIPRPRPAGRISIIKGERPFSERKTHAFDQSSVERLKDDFWDSYHQMGISFVHFTISLSLSHSHTHTLSASNQRFTSMPVEVPWAPQAPEGQVSRLIEAWPLSASFVALTRIRSITIEKYTSISLYVIWIGFNLTYHSAFSGLSYIQLCS